MKTMAYEIALAKWLILLKIKKISKNTKKVLAIF
jgi:hypothetical protein